MEVDDVPHSLISQAENNDKLYIFLSTGGPLIHTIDSISLSSMTLLGFRSVLVNRTIVPNLSFDILYNGAMLSGEEKTLGSFSVKSNTVIHIVPRKNASSPTSPSKKNFSEKQLVHLSLALRTAFLSTAFARTVESLSTSETLETLFAIAPQLRADPVGIAIIQSAHMILQFSEPEPLKQLAGSRPWVVDALNFIAATVHGEKKTVGGPMPRGLMASQLLNPAMLGDEEEEEDVEEGRGSRATGSQPNNHAHITREQLTQALSAINSIDEGRGLGQFLQANPPTPSFTPRTPTSMPLPSQNPIIPSPLSTPGTVLTGDMVARAMYEAISMLPPDVRADQMTVFRNLARQVVADGETSGEIGGQGSGQDTVAPASSQEALGATASSLLSQLSPESIEALRKMRELGIQDQRLSLLALRVSGGDVGTAAELIFSGWQGEGAETEGIEDGDDPMTE